MKNLFKLQLIYLMFISQIIILLGCANTFDIKDSLEKNLELKLPDKYEVLSSETNSAMGDYSEAIHLKFDSINFSFIINQILNSSFYIDNFTELPQINLETPIGSKKWYKRSNGYKFEYNIDGFREFVECYIDTNKKTLYYEYAEE